MKELLPLETLWMDFKGMLSKISQIEKNNAVWSHLYMESKNQPNTELMNTDNRLVFDRGRGWRVDEIGEGGQKVQTSSYKINKKQKLLSKS